MPWEDNKFEIVADIKKATKWHIRYLRMADHVSHWSEDESTKVGAVIVNLHQNRVVSLGYNGFPRGVDQTIRERHARPAKYSYTVHAERNAIYNARTDISGCALYLNWSPNVCDGCAHAIIQSGIEHVICSDKPFPGVGDGVSYNTKIGMEMLKEAGVEVLKIPGAFYDD